MRSSSVALQNLEEFRSIPTLVQYLVSPYKAYQPRSLALQLYYPTCSFLPFFSNDREQNPSVPVHVFTDADISERPDDVAQALRESKVLFCSLVVDFVQVQWIKERCVMPKEMGE